MQIKLQLGKLRLDLPLAQIIETQQQTNNVEVLPVTLEHSRFAHFLDEFRELR
jgi:PIN domain nuclease of toxin-antitoxin system